MKQKITMIILFIGLNVIAQTQFEKGYFISLDGEKTECLINSEFSTMVNTLYYKLKDGKILRKKINGIKEVKTQTKFFIRKNVSIDEIKKLNKIKELNRVSKSILLEVLISGDVNIFSHFKNASNFFYQINGSKIKNLEYKKFISKNDFIVYNKTYQKQLWTEFNCNSKPSYFTKINYSKKDIIQFFKNYLNCKNITFTEYKNNTKYKIKDYFNLYPLLGLTYNSLNHYSPSSRTDYKITPNTLSFSYGTELELSIPQLRFISLSYSFLYTKTNTKGQFITKSIFESTNSKYNININSSSSNFKLRYNYFLENNKIIFFNIGTTLNTTSSTFQYNRTLDDLKIIDLEFKKHSVNLNLGMGYKFDKYFLELNYSNLNLDLYGLKGTTVTKDNWVHKNNSFSILFGYNLF